MSELYLMITITDRQLSRKFSDFFEECHLKVLWKTLANGTATNTMLDYFGLEASEKVAIFNIATRESWIVARQGLRNRLNIDLLGSGVSFIVPLSSIGGKKPLFFLTQEQNFVKGEESALKDTTFELVVVIANQGYAAEVMHAAREAGAAGGTVIHAKGTGMEGAEQFLGVSLASEKEMILIVVKSEQRNAIVRAVMDRAGLNSKARSIVFSLPVTSTVGLRVLETQSGNDEL
ncbi:MAG: P-II family nitrogen regulator [Clostridia bacterium]|nr:P-II family nitrogen regulator [Clostridia bacterium]